MLNINTSNFTQSAVLNDSVLLAYIIMRVDCTDLTLAPNDITLIKSKIV
jgi:hypothetical protein